AEGAVVVGGRVRGEHQVRLAGRGGPQGVEHAPGLHVAELPLPVDLDDAVEVLGEVHHDGDIAALPGEAGAAAAGEDRGAVPAGRRDRGNHVVDRPRDD